MKQRLKITINLVEWNLLPVKWDYSSGDLGIEHKRYYFLCFMIEIYKTKGTYE
jgi:hypothetical protein